MRVGVITAFMDYHRRGKKNRGVLQPLIGAYVGGLLPKTVDVEVVNETWRDPDWSRDYDLLFISSMHSDFDRARQISHYWRRRGAQTVYGGNLASTYPDICQPFFDSVIVGDPEGSVPEVFRDFAAGDLAPRYVSRPYAAERVPTPRFELLADQQVVPLSLEATRGCPFRCDFCALTGLGTRFHTRPVEQVVGDIVSGQRMLRGRAPAYKRRMVSFVDNNIGGNPKHLDELSTALRPLGLRWGAALTFNVVTDEDRIRRLSRSGCRFLFMGLESFNQEALTDMNKVQNAIDQTQAVLDRCRRHGILVVGGLMVSPVTDNWSYVETIPQRLRESGLHMPTFICFECPIPGTPHFNRLASEERPALLPGALLRDFSGYTLVVRPKREPLDEFVDHYRWLLDRVYSLRVKARKAADDLSRFLLSGHPMSGLVDAVQLSTALNGADPERTYLAGTDTAPPEAGSVPFEDEDFRSEAERRAIVDPWRVTDDTGRVLEAWRHGTRLFTPTGVLTEGAVALASGGLSS